jgi:hypothetical protein
MLIVVDLSILHLNFSGLGFMWDYSSLGLEMGLNSIRKSESVLKTLWIWAFWGFGVFWTLVESTTFAKNLTFAKILVPCHAILHAVENLHATGQLEASVQIILVPYRTACHRKVHAVLHAAKLKVQLANQRPPFGLVMLRSDN